MHDAKFFFNSLWVPHVRTTLLVIMSVAVSCTTNSRSTARKAFDAKFKPEFKKVAPSQSLGFQKNISAIIAKRCPSYSGEKLSDECWRKITDTFISRLQAYYTYADWSELNLHMKGYPERYQTLEELEQLVFESHRKNLKRAMDEY